MEDKGQRWGHRSSHGKDQARRCHFLFRLKETVPVWHNIRTHALVTTKRFITIKTPRVQVKASFTLCIHSRVVRPLALSEPRVAVKPRDCFACCVVRMSCSSHLHKWCCFDTALTNSSSNEWKQNYHSWSFANVCRRNRIWNLSRTSHGSSVGRVPDL